MCCAAESLNAPGPTKQTRGGPSASVARTATLVVTAWTPSPLTRTVLARPIEFGADCISAPFRQFQFKLHATGLQPGDTQDQFAAEQLLFARRSRRPFAGVGRQIQPRLRSYSRNCATCGRITIARAQMTGAARQRRPGPTNGQSGCVGAGGGRAIPQRGMKPATATQATMRVPYNHGSCENHG